MKSQYNNRFFAVALLFGLLSWSLQAAARPNIGTAAPHSGLKTTATGCQPAVASIDLDINNVRARLMTGGDMWWNIGTQVASYELPKGSGKHSQFAASCWIGGFDAQKQLKVAAQTYRQDGNDYWPGVLGAGGNAPGKTDINACNAWDQFFRVYNSDIVSFQSLYKAGTSPSALKNQFPDIFKWPATGNVNAVSAVSSTDPLPMVPGNAYAPFVDLNGDGVYQPDQGEYPQISGDEFIWWVFNDAGNVKGQTQTASIGVEVQTSAFAYSTQDFLNNSTFCQYRVYNRGALTMDSTYIAVWDDCDLGYYYDDYIGCDTSRGLGIQYNGSNCDGCNAGYPVNSYGTNPPQVGLDYFQGPTKLLPDGTTTKLKMSNFTYYNNDFSTIGNPINGVEIYNYMTGSIRDGERFTDDYIGPGTPSKGYGGTKPTNFVFWADPSDKSGWSECNCNNVPSDRRFIFSAGPFQLLPGAKNDIIFGCVWAPGVGGCPNTNFKTITAIDDQAQNLFEAGFKTTEGPQAPRMVVRELDKKLIFYLVNDYGSNNYKESYGRNDVTPTANYADSIQYHQTVLKAKSSTNPNDSLYKFEGYRVFQLANSSITPADIFDQNTGEVNTANAQEVFQCDVHNGVTRIVNYFNDISISQSTWVPQVKVSGRDSGITHSFELTQNAFAAGVDKSLINYQNYYYVAIAYAYNDFSYSQVTHSGGFNADSANTTQDQPYLASAHGAGEIPISVVTAMPDPTNSAIGQVLNSDFQTGISIKRYAGQGNGGNFLQMDAASETAALDSNVAHEITYLPGNGPISVKVIDPVKVAPLDWELFINGGYNGPTPKYNNSDIGIDSNTGNWTLIAMDPAGYDTIYSESNIGIENEQILEKYGISVTITQVHRPGDLPYDDNGYIGSDITFSDPNKPWLWGVQDQSDSTVLNWIRSGANGTVTTGTTPNPCIFNDNQYSGGFIDPVQRYENLLNNYTTAKSSWAPYFLGAPFYNSVSPKEQGYCPFTINYGTPLQTLYSLYSVDIVLTSDKSKWTRCAVIEMQEDMSLSEGNVNKFALRQHAGWNLGLDSYGSPAYASPDDSDSRGMSWFPGYAINEETGERINIVFGEDSYLKGENGADLIWNPTTNILNAYDGSVIFGGKHYIYTLNTRYDSDQVFKAAVRGEGSPVAIPKAYQDMQWVGMPIVNPSVPLLPLSQGLIPTETRLRFRVTRPYAAFPASDGDAAWISHLNNPSYPFYTFSTKGEAPTPLSDATSNSSKTLLDKINVVPNPYYGYSGYEANRYDTKVRITHLPANATIYIYTLDGILVRTLSKSDPTTSYIDWDIRNAVGLPVASGMYLMDVKAEGLGETVLRWFGAMRPLDVSTY